MPEAAESFCGNGVGFQEYIVVQSEIIKSHTAVVDRSYEFISVEIEKREDVNERER